MKTTYRAIVEIYVEVENEAEACDAISEMLRPMLQEHEPMSCFVDWNYATTPTPMIADEMAQG